MVTEKQLENLKKGKATQFKSGERAARCGRKGGKASGEAKRLLKTFKELDDETTTNEERQKMLERLKLMAMKGNVKAFETYRDTVGLKPKENVEVSGELRNPFAGLSDEVLEKLADADG